MIPDTPIFKLAERLEELATELQVHANIEPDIETRLNLEDIIANLEYEADRLGRY